MVKLYRFKNGEIVLVDYGVPSKAPEYVEQGYIVAFGDMTESFEDSVIDKYVRRMCD